MKSKQETKKGVMQLNNHIVELIRSNCKEFNSLIYKNKKF